MSFENEFPRGVVQSEMSGFKPDLISGFPRVEASCCPGGHEFSSGFMGSKCFFLGFIESG